MVSCWLAGGADRLVDEAGCGNRVGDHRQMARIDILDVGFCPVAMITSSAGGMT